MYLEWECYVQELSGMRFRQTSCHIFAVFSLSATQLLIELYMIEGVKTDLAVFTFLVLRTLP